MRKKNKEKDNKDKGKDANSSDNVAYESSFAQVTQGKKVCWVCGGDHLANVCPHRDKIPMINGTKYHGVTPYISEECICTLCQRRYK